MDNTLFTFFRGISLLFILSIAVACGKEKDKGNKTLNPSVILQKTDSIAIPYTGQITVHDLNPAHQTVLVTEQGSDQPQIILMDFNGKTRAALPIKDILPDGQASLLAPLKIEDNGSFLAYAANGLSAFDFSGELLSTLRHSTPGILSSSNFAMGEGMEKVGNRTLYVNQEAGNIDRKDEKRTRSLRTLVWLDAEKGVTEPFLPFPESSIFRQGGSFFRAAWKPAFTIADDLIFVIFGVEPVIYAFNTSPPYSLVSSIPIDLPEYQYDQGEGKSSSRLDYFELPFTSGKILNIKSVDGHFIVAYFPGVDPRDAKVYSNTSTRELAHVSREIQKKYPTRIAVFDSLGNLVNDYIPTGLDPDSMVLRNGELWMLGQADEDMGQDHFSLFKVGLRLDHQR